MSQVRRKQLRLVTYGAAAAIGLSLIAYAVLVIREPMMMDYWVTLGIVTSMMIAGAYEFFEARRRKLIDSKLPDLLRDIADAQRTGLTLVRALEAASRKDYGPLTKELRKAVTQMSWGVPLETALRGFADRAGTPMARRAALMIIEVSRSGGDVARLLDAVATFTREFQEIEAERAASMRGYLGVVYIGLLVFIVAVVLLLNTFFAQMSELQPTASGLVQLQFSYLFYKRIFYHMAVVQAVFGGLIAGKLGEGSVVAGLKHVAFLATICLLAFVLFVV